MSETVVKVEGVSKKFCRSLKKSLWYGLQDLGREITGRRHGGNGELRPDEFWAVKDVSFELKRGECLGLIGRNGAGKTTLLKMLNGLIKPDTGRIEMRGRVGALIALGAGFNPILTGRENIYVNASVLGLGKREIEAKCNKIIDFAELGKLIDSPVQYYSSGMVVRLGFAVATALEPDIILLDEVLAVGDTAFRAKCFQRIGEILTNKGVIFVSHDQNQIARVCDRVIFLESGSTEYEGSVREGLTLYRLSVYAARRNQVLACDGITDIQLELTMQSVNWRDDLDLILKFNADRQMLVGLCLLHFMKNEDFVSHADLTAGNLHIRKGRNEWRITVKNLQFVAGRVFVSVSMFSQDKKSIIMHLLNVCHFEMQGNMGYGPSILHESALQVECHRSL